MRAAYNMHPPVLTKNTYCMNANGNFYQTHYIPYIYPDQFYVSCPGWAQTMLSQSRARLLK